jgi:hypothetical protein
MASVTTAGWTAPAPDFDMITQLWMLPIQFSLDLMDSSLALFLAFVPRAKDAVEAASENIQHVAYAAEEQMAQVDEGPGEMIPTPAALIA